MKKVDDCADVSLQVSTMMDVEYLTVIYNLEVSSPGFYHPLFIAGYYMNFAGKRDEIGTAHSRVKPLQVGWYH